MKNPSTPVQGAKWGLLVSFLAVFALVSVFVITGCSDNPLDSSAVVTTESTFFDQPFDEVAFAKVTSTTEVINSSAYLTDETGGTVPLTPHWFEVLPQSFPADTMFTVLIVSVDDASVVYDFGPDGLVFSEAATLHISVTSLYGKRATEVSFYWLNETTNLWELQGVYKADAAGYAHVPIEHFSKFGIKS